MYTKWCLNCSIKPTGCPDIQVYHMSYLYIYIYTHCILHIRNLWTNAQSMSQTLSPHWSNLSPVYMDKACTVRICARTCECVNACVSVCEYVSECLLYEGVYIYIYLFTYFYCRQLSFYIHQQGFLLEAYTFLEDRIRTYVYIYIYICYVYMHIHACTYACM